jgi:hypothetical protein
VDAHKRVRVRWIQRIGDHQFIKGEAMKTKGMILAAVVAALAGCSSAPSNSEIKQAITKQFGDTPNDLSCSVDADATTKLRA